MFDYNNLQCDGRTATGCQLVKNLRDIGQFTTTSKIKTKQDIINKVTIWDIPGSYTRNPAMVVTATHKKSTRIYWLTLLLTLMLITGLGLGFLVKLSTNTIENQAIPAAASVNLPQIEGIFVNHSFSTLNNQDNNEETNKTFVTFVANLKMDAGDEQILRDSEREELLISDDIFWSDYVESLLPQGFTRRQSEDWNRYVRKGAVAVKLEKGCGRMQNRLVTFADGRRACVRYRQNTDQIQGELFSFYLSQILNLRNLVPSTVGVVDVKLPLWQRLSNEIASAQWHSQRPVVLTQYIPNLDVGGIPKLVRPAENLHLNKLDLTHAQKAAGEIVELAQWSDLIIFDYLTANLDRVVNNLYNHQWNSNIMEAPAHNLAKDTQSNLLVFLDNESGLLHGYRLLEKYEAYHGLLLDNLCVFRRSTAERIAALRRDGNVGLLLNSMFEKKTNDNDRIRDILPTIPEKSVKILNGRIRRVHEQILKCQGLYKDSQ